MPRWFLSTRAQSVGGPVSPVKILDADRPGYSGDLMPDLLAAIRGRELWVAPKQCALGSRPDAENDVVRARLLEQIAIAVAKKASGAGADLEEAFLGRLDWRHLKLTN